MIAQSVATDEETSAGYEQAFEDLGADELVWMPCSDDLGQVELLAGAVGERVAQRRGFADRAAGRDPGHC